MKNNIMVLLAIILGGMIGILGVLMFDYYKGEYRIKKITERARQTKDFIPVRRCIHYFPEWIEFCNYKDSYGNFILIETSQGHIFLRSIGPDGKPKTKDDRVMHIKIDHDPG